MQLAPSLHRIGSDLVNVYLIEDDAGVTIVDAGLPGQYDELEPELASMGRSLAEVRAILLTHGDTDHIGFAERLRREHGVPVLATAQSSFVCRRAHCHEFGTHSIFIGELIAAKHRADAAPLTYYDRHYIDISEAPERPAT